MPWRREEDERHCAALEDRVAALADERRILLDVLTAARAVDAIHRGVQGPQIMRLRTAIQVYDGYEGHDRRRGG